ncbi:MAG: hypothetical protein ABEN55_16240 [Bradymonadaceae bacterium]
MDLSTYDNDTPDGWVQVELDGETHRLGFKTPDPLEIASIERESNDYRAELFRAQKEHNRITRRYGVTVDEEADEGLQEVAREQLDDDTFEAFVSDLQAVKPPDPEGLAPRISFIAERVITAEPVGDHGPIHYDGDEWPDIPAKAREAFIRRLGRSQIWDVYEAITEDEGLDEDEKKS